MLSESGESLLVRLFFFRDYFFVTIHNNFFRNIFPKTY